MTKLEYLQEQIKVRKDKLESLESKKIELDELKQKVAEQEKEIASLEAHKEQDLSEIEFLQSWANDEEAKLKADNLVEGL